VVDHISIQELRNYTKKKLQPNRYFAIKRHLNSCNECFEELEALSVGAFFAPYVECLQKTDAASSHLPEELIREFWEGTIKDQRTRDEIFEHFLRCKQCDAKLDEIITEAVSKQYSQENKYSTLAVKATAALTNTLRQILRKRLNEDKKKIPNSQDEKVKSHDEKQEGRSLLRNKPKFILRALVGRESNWVKIHIFLSHLPHPSQNPLAILRIWVKKLWHR
jgi:hypothetical protein